MLGIEWVWSFRSLETSAAQIRGFPGIQVKQMLQHRSSEIGIRTSNPCPLPRIEKVFRDALQSVENG